MHVEFKSELNSQQYEAVRKVDGPILVLAGAGTGKTRVITYRIAYLIQEANVYPHNILAVTFTNKAASEMKYRLKGLVGEEADAVWMGTFHSICLRILRRDGHIVGLPGSFGVIDQDDRLSLFREILKEIGIDHKKHPAKQYLNKTSAFKNTPQYINGEVPKAEMHRIDEVFSTYQKKMAAQNLIDFDDMLAFVIRILKENEEVASYYRALFKYILVDEYQDTNEVQFLFLRLLSGNEGNICVVGDDDQSIYGWRGADIRNILQFDDHFKGASIVKLTDNYRSNSEILNTANELIRYNKMRKGKDLTPVLGAGGTVEPRMLTDEIDEAEYVLKLISSAVKKGLSLDDIAVLYRTNAQSRNFEVALNREGIPYKVVGGIGFYQRREIKDVLSYLKFFDNPFDLPSFRRSVKTPKRGVGDATIEKIAALAEAEGISLYDALKMSAPAFRGNTQKALGEYLHVLGAMEGESDLGKIVDNIVEATGYLEFVKRTEDSFEAEKRMNNIQELFNAAASFQEANPDGTLTDFLAAATLVTSTDEDTGAAVRLMTIHSAKGLEFDTVFLTGLENGLFPLHSHSDETDELEEERRLCYVGITRAKKKLYITYADRRMLYGRRMPSNPSFFLEEMGVKEKPSFNVSRVKPAEPVIRSVKKGAKDTDKPSVDGKQVVHNKFGEGRIISTTGSGSNAKADVFFKKHGFKKIMLSFLEIID